MTMLLVNLPVTDLNRATAFYTAIGFTPNPAFSDHNAACVVVEQDHSALMLVTREYFQTVTDRPIGDPAAAVSVATAVFLDTREAVDARVADGLAAGGTENQPASDYGFMYQRQITDPDRTCWNSAGWPPPAPKTSAPRIPVPRPARGPDADVHGTTRLRAILRRHPRPGAGGRTLGAADHPPATAYGGHFGPAELLIRVDGPAVDVARGDGPVDLAFTAGPDIRRLMSGELAPDRALATGVIEVRHGDRRLLDRFARTFHLAA